MANAFSAPEKGALAFCAAFSGPALTNAGTYSGRVSEVWLPMLRESGFVTLINKSNGAEMLLNIKPGKYLVSLVGITTEGNYLAKAQMLNSQNEIVLKSNLNVNSAQVLPFTEIYLEGQYKPQVFRQLSDYSSAGIITIYKR